MYTVYAVLVPFRANELMVVIVFVLLLLMVVVINVAIVAQMPFGRPPLHQLKETDPPLPRRCGVRGKGRNVRCQQ